MKTIMMIIILSVPFLVNAQLDAREEGICFIQGLSWEQIIEKAKLEQKYIFVDFFATWCGPCKEMDQKVYQARETGVLVNQRFLSIKIQIDRTSADNGETKSWYLIADSLSQCYHIAGLPTLLFLSPDGLMICKEEGYKSLTDFAQLINYTLTVSKGYKTLIGLYREENLPYSEMGNLALDAIKYGDRSVADSIARAYKTYYLDSLSSSAALTRENLWFIANFPYLIQTDDPYFNLFFYHASEAEEKSNTRRGFAHDVVSFVISKEEIDRYLYKDGKVIVRKVDWERLYQSIMEKYSKQYADEILPDARMKFYEITIDWKDYVAYFNKRLKKHPPRSGGRFLGGMIDDVWALNVAAWNLFLHCNDMKDLKEALKWSRISIKLAINHKDDITQYLDTEANLLYKLRRVNEAIVLERHVLELSKNRPEYKINLAKMDRGCPTWPSK